MNTVEFLEAATGERLQEWQKDVLREIARSVGALAEVEVITDPSDRRGLDARRVGP